MFSCLKSTDLKNDQLNVTVVNHSKTEILTIIPKMVRNRNDILDIQYTVSIKLHNQKQKQFKEYNQKQKCLPLQIFDLKHENEI